MSPSFEPSFFTRALRTRSSIANMFSSSGDQTPRRYNTGENTPSSTNVSLSCPQVDSENHTHEPQYSSPKQPSSSRYDGLRDRFWSKSTANHFDEQEEEQSLTQPFAAAAASSAYVPTHAAVDFSRNAKRSRLRGSRLDATAEEDDETECYYTLERMPHHHTNNVDAERLHHTYSVDDYAQPRSSNNAASNHLSPMHLTTSAESNDDYKIFLAQAEAGDRAARRRRKAWEEMRRYGSSRRDSGHSSGDGTAHSSGNGNGNGNGNVRGLKRQPSVLGQRIAEYIKPPRMMT